MTRTLHRSSEAWTRGAAWALAVACCASSGCVVYDPALVVRDAGMDAQVPDAGPCVLRVVPERPTMADGDGPEVAFALRQVVLEQRDGWRDTGYDLDDRCTQAPDYDSECSPPSGGNPEIDGFDGIDNVFGARLFPVVGVVRDDLEESARRAQEGANGPPVLRIRGWNGLPNDPRIDLAITQATFAVPSDGSMTPPPAPAPGTTLPAWDGQDWVWVRRESFLMGDPERPLVRDDQAYVVDGQIVARIPDRVDITFAADLYGVLVRITDARAVGRLTPEGNLEEVVVSGRWSLDDLILTAANIGVCEGTSDYNILTRTLDRIADVRSTPGTGGAGVMCNAISVGVEFEVGTRVRIAGLADGVPLANLCSGDVDGGVAADAGASSDAGPPDGGPRDAGP